MNMTFMQLLALMLATVMLTVAFILWALFRLSHRSNEGHCALGCGGLGLTFMGLIGFLLLVTAFAGQ